MLAQNPRPEPQMPSDHDIFQDAHVAEDFQVLESPGHTQFDAPVRFKPGYVYIHKIYAA